MALNSWLCVIKSTSVPYLSKGTDQCINSQYLARAGLLACEQAATIATRFFGVRSGVDDGEPLNAEAGAIAAVGHFRVCLHVTGLELHCAGCCLGDGRS